MMILVSVRTVNTPTCRAEEGGGEERRGRIKKLINKEREMRKIERDRM
jgi:hypothetical protein